MIKNEFTITMEPGATPEIHESKTAEVLVKYGDVLFLKPINIKGIHTPDIIWLGEKWEIKAPKGSGRWLLENTLKDAVKQSNHIIVDLRRIKMTQVKSIHELKKQFNKMKSIKALKVITKQHDVIDFLR